MPLPTEEGAAELKLFAAILLGTAFGTVSSIVLGLIPQHAISVTRVTIFAIPTGIFVIYFVPYKQLSSFGNNCVGFLGGSLIGTGVGLVLRFIGAFIIFSVRNFIFA